MEVRLDSEGEVLNVFTCTRFALRCLSFFVLLRGSLVLFFVVVLATVRFFCVVFFFFSRFVRIYMARISVLRWLYPDRNDLFVQLPHPFDVLFLLY